MASSARRLGRLPFAAVIRGRQRYQPFFHRLHRTALAGLGYGNPDPNTNGDFAFLRQLAEGWDSPTLVDAGSFHGEWTLAALSSSPDATVYAIEPNRESYARLQGILEGRAKIHNIAIGAVKGEAEMFAPPDAPSQGSLHRRDYSRMRGLAPPQPVGTVPVTTLDDFCAEQGISRIDFLKLDLEGHEVAALDGAKSLLRSGAIEAIQFEFGGANIDAGTYLRDFLDRLEGTHDLHRIIRDGLDPVAYSEDTEIFAYGNFVALRRS